MSSAPSMHSDVIEAPRGTEAIPEWGAVILLSLDPVASVAALEDAQASEEAARVPRKTCLAIVDAPIPLSYKMPLRDTPLQLKMFSIGVGRPKDAPDAAVPLHPNSGDAGSRDVLHASSALPISDLFVHTLDPLTTVISRIHLAPQIPSYTFTEPKLETLARATYEDFRRFAEIVNDRPYPDTETEEDSSSSSISMHHSVPSVLKPDADSAEANGLVRQMWPHVEVWLDISTATHVDHPREVQQAINQLIPIEKEWAKRTVAAMLVDQQQTAAWAQGVASSGTPQTEHIRNDACTSLHDDGDLAPEDAIEHRKPTDSGGEEEPAPNETVRASAVRKRLQARVVASAMNVRGLTARISTKISRLFRRTKMPSS
ncbi:hypothetical protein EXIGLDRAFT_772410 [Exidia glandulosa HHB12029]|uniref:Uncharacterized protein n=1 Tax=Exidia glandulosa HHB12029 TaxID=1314781 RepID=A0A165FBU3_EXIGL|nr:hypothetical protein EXIGLDRAFT_772410 [Exidia glandulosa HHB12029]